MNYDWYFILNLQDFIDSGLQSRTLTVLIDGVGSKDILITQGELYSIVYEGVMLTIGMNDNNPFEFEDLAVYYDENDAVWLGIAHAD